MVRLVNTVPVVAAQLVFKFLLGLSVNEPPNEIRFILVGSFFIRLRQQHENWETIGYICK